MKKYKIKFNGKQETWIRSDGEMTFNKTQEWIKEKGGTPTTVSELWAIDSDTQKPRWLLLKEAGAKFWCWAGEDPEEKGKENPRYAHIVSLRVGYMYGYTRNGSNYGLCRVGF